MQTKSAWVPSFVAACLLASVLMAFGKAYAADTRVLEGVDARRIDGHVDLVIGLTQAFRYVRHSASIEGRALRIELQENRADIALPPEGRGFSTLGGATAPDVPLERIISDSIGTQLFLNLRFRETVEVLAVRSGPDQNSVIVTLAAQAVDAPAAAPVAEAATTRSGVYAIELRSMGAPLGAERKAFLATLEGEWVYQSLVRHSGAQRYHLRLGFFANAAAANNRLKELRAEYPDAWVSLVSAIERDKVMQGAWTIDPAKIMIEADAASGIPPMSLERIALLMEDAKASIADGDLTRATTIYQRISAYPVQPYRQLAQERLGVVQEKAGRLTMARDTYETYLLIYPDGEGADRVRQRLAGVRAAISPDQARSFERRDRQEAHWEWFGGVGQFYRWDQLSQTQTDVFTLQSRVSNDLYLSGRYRGERTDWQLVLSGSYDNDFLSDGENEARFSNLYLDFATQDQSHRLRLGRQSRVSGALGRIDGLSYGYRFTSRLRGNVFAGLPVELSSDGIETERKVFGLNLDVGPLAEHWNLNVYGVNQTLNGLVDRRALGLELRYFREGRSLFGLFDYDVEFSEPNIMYVVGSIPIGGVGSSVNFTANRRSSPMLSLRNALIGQGTSDFASLQAQYDETSLRELARDRSATSTSYSLGFSHRLGAVWQIGGDVSSSTLSATKASGGVDAFPETGPDWYANLRLMGNSWLRSGDIASLGLRQISATTYDGTAINVGYRMPFSRLSLNPLLRVERRTLAAGDTQWIYTPELRLRYRVGRSLNLEFEASWESYREDANGDPINSDLLSIYAGYRYDF